LSRHHLPAALAGGTQRREVERLAVRVEPIRMLDDDDVGMHQRIHGRKVHRFDRAEIREYDITGRINHFIEMRAWPIALRGCFADVCNKGCTPGSTEVELAARCLFGGRNELA
jgi:hypothetical protein